MWSFVFHRISGLALTVYLVMHVWVIHHIHQGRQSYDSMMEFLHHPFLRVGEAFLLAAVLFHSINGLRITFMDGRVGMKHYRFTFWVVFAICAVLGIAGGVVIVFFT